MTLTQWDPFRTLRRRGDLLDDFVRDFFARGEPDAMAPLADVAESDGEVTVKMAVPGVAKEDIRISVDNDVLEVHGETRKETEEKHKNYSRQEIRYGAFRRAITLPAAVDVERAAAQLKDGMLVITMPKSKVAKGHQIAIAA